MREHLTAAVLLGLTVVCHLVIQAVGTLKLRVVRNKIGATIKCRSDLDEVRAAIQVNLLLGVLVICNGAVLIGVLIWLSNGRLWMACLTALAVEQATAWLLFRPIEKQFKALPVESSNEDLAAEYKHYLQQWAGPHLFLKRSRPNRGGEPNAAPPHR